MNILVVGGGGREHTIVWKIAQSPKVEKIYCAPGNGGIAELAECVDIKATDIDAMVQFAKERQIDLVMVAPDDPLVLGMVDAMEAAGIRAFGPRKNAAIIEGSKVFSKELMKKYNIPTAAYEVFTDSASAIDYVKRQNSFPAVIKAEGLALGKGVIIAQDLEEAVTGIRSIMDDKQFGDSGNRIVIEEYLQGPEVSVLAFTDGKTVVPMVSAQDHKRAYDNDEGLNTGGMGTFSPSRLYTDDIAAECMDNIFLPTIKAMQQEGRPFKGVLYFGLMMTKNGVKVIEYNARFGDPETQVVLPRLKTDLVEIMEAIIDERLDTVNIEWDDNAAVCVVLASGGYPTKYQTGYEIKGLETAKDNIIVFHAGTKRQDGKIVTAGGRVLGVTAVSATLDQAIADAYKAVESISFQDMHYRKDIGIKKYN
ncbi:MAG TPA: phosphoribosylamine--glycine ligase [Candidatus Avimonoglobus intestinipullorum]|uniref:Phosphoribosylamine--glycine ligase n=1 Tax=Candidatus Avimonoglobus intestinipullorum TaxID=2840699 RepID=A0A9D1LW71_9FIRM|nr:phosphoribosylamine--glycine ligase [Candidatus Avimonoglobus intestinipullorum]